MAFFLDLSTILHSTIDTASTPITQYLIFQLNNEDVTFKSITEKLLKMYLTGDIFYHLPLVAGSLAGSLHMPFLHSPDMYVSIHREYYQYSTGRQ